METEFSLPTSHTTPTMVSGHAHTHGATPPDFHNHTESDDLEDHGNGYVEHGHVEHGNGYVEHGNGHVDAWAHENTPDLEQGEGPEVLLEQGEGPEVLLEQGEGPEVLLEQQTQKTQCKEAKMKKQVMGNEWYSMHMCVYVCMYLLYIRGFTSANTAHLLWRRAQRHKNLHSTATRRKNLANPSTRLARFKKQQNPARATPPGGVSGSSSLEELSAKEHSRYTYTYVCITFCGLRISLCIIM